MTFVYKLIYKIKVQGLCSVPVVYVLSVHGFYLMLFMTGLFRHGMNFVIHSTHLS